MLFVHCRHPTKSHSLRPGKIHDAKAHEAVGNTHSHSMAVPTGRGSVSDLESRDSNELKEFDANVDGGHGSGFMRQTRVTSRGTFAVQSLGFDALEATFPLSEHLQSAGLDAAAAADHAARLRRKYPSPFAWPTGKKVFVLATSFIAAMISAYSAGAYALGGLPLKEEWQLNDIEFNVGITTFVSSFAFSPMILAPVSEVYGRYWVFIGSGITFLAGTVGCAVTQSYAGMLVSRFITGCGAAVFATIVGGVVADIFHKENRNTPMAMFSASIFAGTGLGPLVSGAVVDSLGWRWIFYVQVITVGTATLIIALLFKETRSNVVLQRLCNALNKVVDEYSGSAQASESTTPDQPRVLFKSHIAERKLDASVILTSLSFPMKLLISEPVVLSFSVWVSFAWAILYMQFSSIGIVFRDVHDFSNAQVGAVYVAVIVATILGSAFAIVQDPVLRRLWPQRMATPEGRLLSPAIQSILFPAGLFWFGWTSRSGLPWILPTLAIGSCTLGIFSIYLAVFNYLADTYGRYSSSAQAAQSMCRNLLAGIFPLFTHIMLKNLTYPGAGSMLGGIGLLLSVIPWLLFFFGQRIRARSPFAKIVMEES